MQTNQCFSCRFYGGVRTCQAFEGRDIPDEIWKDEHDHRKPFQGDRGIMFDQDPDKPEYYEDESSDT